MLQPEVSVTDEQLQIPSLQRYIVVVGETVEADDVLAPRQQPLGQVRPDETGCSGDKHGHVPWSNDIGRPGTDVAAPPTAARIALESIFNPKRSTKVYMFQRPTPWPGPAPAVRRR